MSKKKNKLIPILGALVVLVVIAVVALFMSMNSMIKSGIETVMPKLIGVPVTVGSVGISPLSGSGTVEGLVIGNPEGYATDSAFQLNVIDVQLEPRSLLSDTIVINKIHIIDPVITYEVGLGNSNIGTLKKNVEAAIPAGGESSDASKSSKNVHIQDFQIKGAKIRLSAKILAGQNVAVPLSDVTMTDVRTDSVESAIAQVFGSVTDLVVAAVEASGKLLSAGKDLVKDTGKAVGDSLKGAAKGFKGLFKGKE